MNAFATRLGETLCALVLAVAAVPALPAEPSYPSKPIRMVVPWPAGGITDVTARIVAEGLRQQLGQPVVVDNLAGASGKIGIQSFLRAPADGYTLLLANGVTHGTLPVTDPKLGYDPINDFSPIGFISATPFIVAVSPQLPVRTVAELIAYAKANPGKLNYGTPGNGSGAHFAGEMFKSMAGVELTHVPYKGASAVLPDLMAGRIDLTFDPTLRSAVESGRVHALATTDLKRSPTMPGLPTLDESGLKGYQMLGWNGLMTSAGVPPDIRQTLQTALAAVLKKDEVRKQFADAGILPAAGTGTEFTSYMQAEAARFQRVAKAQGLHFEN
jgi:tripartite-type tricarboxylate transporter receptor subunit TctC